MVLTAMGTQIVAEVVPAAAEACSRDPGSAPSLQEIMGRDRGPLIEADGLADSVTSCSLCHVCRG